MHCDTTHHLLYFDNEKDFERLAADVLNYVHDTKHVQPTAPNGGPDGGIDVSYVVGATNQQGVAFVTLRKDVKSKFGEDFEKIKARNAVIGEISLFCNQAVSHSHREEFKKMARSIGSELRIYDREALRSMLDTHLQDLREKYLRIPVDDRDSPRTIASGVELKLTIGPSSTMDLSNAMRVHLMASAPENEVIPVYAITLFVEENARLVHDDSNLNLLREGFFVYRFGRKMFASVFQKVVSPSFGHPIWHGMELSLIGQNTSVVLDMSVKWEKLMVASELHAPGLKRPAVSWAEITRQEATLNFQYSHEQNSIVV
jgi:hypothetical protein